MVAAVPVFRALRDQNGGSMTDPLRGRDLHDLAAGQHGAAHRNQLLRLLIPPSTIDDCVLRGRRRTAAPEVLVGAGSPPTWRQRVMVATLTTGGWASHRTAAALHGLDGFSPGLIEVVTDRAGWRRRAGLVRHTAKD